ncbi:MAG: hypothetical protein LBT84_05365, partial [Spirochaetia bacterium]|nr:hypothetical protein [Spirochaetia bacterium]
MSDLKKENFDEETGIPPELYAGFDENTPGEGPDAPDDVTVTLSENPYASDGKKTSDIVRLFYIHNIPVIPVVSKRGILLGILKKDDVISELSDLERSHKYNIDQFVTKLAKKMSFEELLQYGEIREFPVINIFGEGQGRWTRVQLFAAADSASAESGDGMKAQKDEQVLEWMIYLILEHIPRALYALNENGKTIFYNSHFEHIYTGKIGNDVDVLFVEQTIKDAGKNEVLSGYNLPEIYFYNKDFDLNYEKIPLLS